MSRNGVFQLRKIIINYCDIGGSSRGVREYINTELFKFAEKNPQIQFEVKLRRGHHPYVAGEYVHGKVHTHPLQNVSAETVAEKLLMLRNQWGTKAKKMLYGKKTRNPSIQGEWNPLLFRKFKNFGPSVDAQPSTQ
eukprot:GEZU01004701.1.p2 GENE.GEZU01004701.1~~GEZU01004701.1.p2  ORF type:complete len:151 (+),score=20.81 GEZU01004701.1:48-455(+)